jgi:hypothetical protein
MVSLSSVAAASFSDRIPRDRNLMQVLRFAAKSGFGDDSDLAPGPRTLMQSCLLDTTRPFDYPAQAGQSDPSIRLLDRRPDPARVDRMIGLELTTIRHERPIRPAMR